MTRSWLPPIRNLTWDQSVGTKCYKCIYPPIIQREKHPEGGNLILQVKDNQDNIIGNTQFESSLINDYNVHQEDMRLFDVHGQQSQMILHCSFQMLSNESPR